jgi:hypothetical protein
MIKDRKIGMILAGTAGCLLVIFMIIILAENNGAGIFEKKAYSDKTIKSFDEAKIRDYMREKNKTTTTVEKVELAQQVIDLGSFPLTQGKTDANLVVTYTSAVDLNSIQAGLENWDKLTEQKKKEVTEKIKSAIIDIMVSDFKRLSYKDIESNKKNYQVFFKTLAMVNDNKNQNIRVKTGSPEAAEELQKIKEFLNLFQDVNTKKE